MAESEPSYIDYETFLDPSFSPTSFANTLTTSTNNPSDTPLDLSTPLSRVLFDIQEIDTHIHTLTTKSALPLLTHARDQNDAGQRVLHTVEAQVSVLKEGYERLEKDVLRKWESAEEVRGAAERSWATVRLARAVGRCLMLGRQLEGQLLELSPRVSDAGGGGGGSAMVVREDHRALIRASHTLLMLRRMFTTTADGEEGYGLDRVKVMRTLRSDLVTPAENSIKARAQQIVNKFSLTAFSLNAEGSAASMSPRGQSSGTTTYAQQEEARSRMISAITALYLLSPTPKTNIPASDFAPELLLATLKGYIHTAVSTSLAVLSRGLSILSSLDRALLEVSTRCQHIVALESLLEDIKPPAHPFLIYPSGQQDENENQARIADSAKAKSNLLQPLLQALDTSSLPSYFWRSLASSLSPRVQEIMSRGGVSARTLRSNRDRLRDDIRACVLRGSQLPSTGLNRARMKSMEAPIVVGNWEREAAVMVGAVISVHGR
ncbi:Conserved oligomeric Golgi complex subunit [Emydomyces testavorans]|uniref:Conserved oligomeric Golgi complex subunit 5 n=1 Tax=Emydomyces testavorans TaxID=2070801 RepID=A0AAF0IL69_9EURO|nr:Conserved oligomeric Golgi complex subunit [Emydomyces testavorans]